MPETWTGEPNPGAAVPLPSTDTVRVGLYYSDEYEHVWFDADDLDDDQEGNFVVEVPADLWRSYMATNAAEREAHRAVLEASGFDVDLVRQREACSTWSGYISPPGPDRHEVSVRSQRLADEEGWGKIPLTSFPDRAAAEAYVAGVPDRFMLVLGAGTRWVDRSDLHVELREGYPGGSVPECRRCGWPRGEHENPGVPE